MEWCPVQMLLWLLQLLLMILDLLQRQTNIKQAAHHIMALPFKWHPLGWKVFSILNWRYMVLITMLNPKWILHLCWKCFYNGLQMTLECRNTNRCPLSGCIPMSLPWKGEPTRKSAWQKNVRHDTTRMPIENQGVQNTPNKRLQNKITKSTTW